MTRVIRDIDVDFIVHIAPSPETFSFTAFESLAAGAYLVTGRQSGNVAAIVRETGRGVIFEDGKRAEEWIRSSAFRPLLEARRRDHAARLFTAIYSDMGIAAAHGGQEQ
jgi:hypothetical protein